MSEVLLALLKIIRKGENTGALAKQRWLGKVSHASMCAPTNIPQHRSEGQKTTLGVGSLLPPCESQVIRLGGNATSTACILASFNY